jgi:FAD:protein FMN transferase
MAVQAPPSPETVERFPCFGGTCVVVVQGRGPAGSPSEAAARARRRLEHWHRQFSRFESSSELSTLNADPHETVSVSPMMARFVRAAVRAAAMTGGLVDPTMVSEIERAGYGESLTPGTGQSVIQPPIAAQPRRTARWHEIHVDQAAGTVSRPPGVRLDSGGIAKGLFGDVLATVLAGHGGFAVAAAGDVRFGGLDKLPRAIQVESPFDDSILHTFELVEGAVATSGTSKRSWLNADGRLAHHLLDPATGTPAFTGLVQVTALAPTGVEAEALSKAALLSGPERAAGWLTYGGVIVNEHHNVEIIDPEPALGNGPRPERALAGGPRPERVLAGGPRPERALGIGPRPGAHGDD